MNADKLGQLVLYIVYQVAELGGYTTTIRLVKFLYLIDLEHQRRYGCTLTGLQWQYYLYGPYAFELPVLGRQLGLEMESEEFTTGQGHRGSLLSVFEPQSFPPGFRFTTESMVNGVLSVWACQDTRDLLEYVYRTEPIRTSRRGQLLDFSLVPAGTRYYDLYIPTEKAAIRKLRESLRSYPEAEEGLVPASVRYDQVLAEGLRALDEDEPAIPDFKGTVGWLDCDQLLSAAPED